MDCAILIIKAKQNFTPKDNDRSVHCGAVVRGGAVPALCDVAHGGALPDLGHHDHERRLPLHEVRRRTRKVHGQRRETPGKKAALSMTHVGQRNYWTIRIKFKSQVRAPQLFLFVSVHAEH